MATGLLTQKAAENAKPKDKAYKLSSGRGFYLYITPHGGKLWRYDYTINGKRKTASFGEFPIIGIKEAEEMKIAFAKKVKAGIDPIDEKRQEKKERIAKSAEQSRIFEIVAREWFEKNSKEMSPTYYKQTLERLENQIFPYIGNRPIATMETQDFMTPIRVKEENKKYDMAHRLAQLIKRICKYAKVSGYIKSNEVEYINEIMVPQPPKKHMATITDPRQVGILLNVIDEYSGDISIKYALKILPYVFVRSGELRAARWTEFNFEYAQWLIPAERMKMRKPHLVPLAHQVIELLVKLKELTPENDLLFPSFAKNRFITSEGLLTALRRMGYKKDVICVHGFRAMASTLLNEQNKYRGDVIEAQLAHSERNAVREAYNHAEYLPERIRMMQEWADYLDALKASTKTTISPFTVASSLRGDPEHNELSEVI